MYTGKYDNLSGTVYIIYIQYCIIYTQQWLVRNGQYNCGIYCTVFTYNDYIQFTVQGSINSYTTAIAGY